MKAVSLFFVLGFAAVQCFVSLQQLGKVLGLSSHSLNQVDICTSGLSLTDKLKKQCEEKIGKATKIASSGISSIHVKLKAPHIPKSETHTHMKADAMVAEATIGLKNGKVVHMRQSSDHMYSSIDLLAHRLKYKLNRLHEKEHDLLIKVQRRAKLANSDVYDGMSRYEYDVEGNGGEGIEAEDDYTVGDNLQYERDAELSVVKSKELDLPPISVQEAVLALSLIEHDFYMFRNKETNEVNVVYRRVAGGVGHINITPREPSAAEAH